MKNLIFLICSFLFFVSCQSKNEKDPLDDIKSLKQQIIFGEAKEGCPHLYLLTPEGVYADSIFSSNFDEVIFHKLPLSAEKYDLAKGLLTVPSQVLSLHITDINDNQYPPDFFLKIGSDNTAWQWQFNDPDGNSHVSREAINYIAQMVEISKGIRVRSKEDVDLNAGIIFGEVYGLCGGDCRKLFLLKSDEIFADANTDTGRDFKNTSFQDQPLSKEDYELAQGLLDIPESLLSSCTDNFGQRIADFDFYFQIQVNNQDKIWIIDSPSDADDIDTNTRLYLSRMMDVARQLK